MAAAGSLAARSLTGDNRTSAWHRDNITQVRTMLLVATVGPPVASLIIMTASYFSYCAVPLLSLYPPPANKGDSP